MHILRICNTFCCSMATVVTRTRLDVTLYIYCLSRLRLLLLHCVTVIRSQEYVSRYSVWNTGWSVRGSNINRGKNFSLLKRPDRLCGQPKSCSIGTDGFIHGGKATGAEVDSSCPSTVVATNKWICTSAARLCLHGVYRDKFTFTFTFACCNLEEKWPVTTCIYVNTHTHTHTYIYNQYFLVAAWNLPNVFLKNPNLFEGKVWGFVAEVIHLLVNQNTRNLG
jgi:hypothetical protein